jgi:N-acetyl-anhydromuramyl-L-alanine amidase AmpD
MLYRLAAVLAVLALPPVSGLEIHQHLLDNAERVRLMDEYARHHYGSPDSTLNSPLMIVVHDTETRSLAQTFDLFAPNTLGRTRPDLGDHGEVNVSIHFVVDRDGTVYQLQPLDRMVRHVIGFNDTALGIENVSPSPAQLTAEQMEADAELIAFLAGRFSTIRYLIGHDEYRDASKPHFALWHELDTTYNPTTKTDPGPRFMTQLRHRLEERYGLSFQD